jgi:spermidine synthase
MDIIPTPHGLRLVQHGVVLSELRTKPGPTHSVFDLLAASIAVLAPSGRVGVLGFAGGGMMAPLRALGVKATIHSVDLERAGFDLFRRHCPEWAAQVNWRQADAVDWLRAQRTKFDLLVDDLSVPCDADVFKPAVSWTVLPQLIRSRLNARGFAVFNLMLSPGQRWSSALPQVTRSFPEARLLRLDEFENRVLVAGAQLPTARALGGALRGELHRIRSRQATRFQARGLD